MLIGWLYKGQIFQVKCIDHSMVYSYWLAWQPARGWPEGPQEEYRVEASGTLYCFGKRILVCVVSWLCWGEGA